MVDLSFLTLDEAQCLKKKYRLDDTEKAILDELVINQLNDYGIMLKLNIANRNKYYDKKLNILYSAVKYSLDH